MAEINTEDKGGKGGKIRSKKQNSKVDLTAMVDLAFLLITFFMLTTSLSTPQSMDLGMPKDVPDAEQIKIAQERTLSVLLGPNDKLIAYMGQFLEPILEPADYEYGKDGIRKLILEKLKSVPVVMGDPEKGLIVLIKPTKDSNYKNLVDILDEMAISEVKVYAIVEITPEEEGLFDK